MTGELSSGTVWTTIAAVCLVTFLCKGIGPFAVGGRELPAPAVRVVALLGPALLAALVVTGTLAEGSEWAVGARAIGLGVGALLLWRRVHMVVVVVAAAGTTALLRLLGME